MAPGGASKIWYAPAKYGTDPAPAVALALVTSPLAGLLGVFGQLVYAAIPRSADATKAFCAAPFALLQVVTS